MEELKIPKKYDEKTSDQTIETKKQKRTKYQQWQCEEVLFESIPVSFREYGIRLDGLAAALYADLCQLSQVHSETDSNSIHIPASDDQSHEEGLFYEAI